MPKVTSSALVFAFSAAICAFTASCTSSEGEAALQSDPGAEAEDALTADQNTGGSWRPKVAANLCMSVSADAKNGSSVVLDTCTSSAAQTWVLKKNALRVLGNKCLDVADGKEKNGARVQIWDCFDNNDNQKWVRDGNRLVWHNSYCLDVTDGNGNAGTALQIWACAKDNTNQSWSFGATTDTSAGSPTPQNTGAATAAQVAQAATDLKALLPLAVFVTNSAATPMGTYYVNAQKRTLTAQDRAYFNDPKAQIKGPDAVRAGNKTFPVTLYPSGTPGPQDVEQHAFGDCVMVAAFASLAYMNPEFIMSIIHDQGDGTFKIDMFDPAGKPLSVAVNSSFYSTDGKTLATVSGHNGVADWATVLEKAFMKYNSIYSIKADGIEGIYSEMAMPAFTGNGNSFFLPGNSLNLQQAATAVKSALIQGMLVTGGFNKALAVGIDETVTSHGYSEFWPADDGSIVSVRNPWGVSETVNGGSYNGAANGVINIPKTETFARAMDLRIMEPGAAATGGRTTPYAIPKSVTSKLVGQDVVITEPRALRLRAEKAAREQSAADTTATPEP